MPAFYSKKVMGEKIKFFFNGDVKTVFAAIPFKNNILSQSKVANIFLTY
jgi:hypothetical protein